MFKHRFTLAPVSTSFFLITTHKETMSGSLCFLLISNEKTHEQVFLDLYDARFRFSIYFGEDIGVNVIL